MVTWFILFQLWLTSYSIWNICTDLFGVLVMIILSLSWQIFLLRFFCTWLYNHSLLLLYKQYGVSVWRKMMKICYFYYQQIFQIWGKFRKTSTITVILFSTSTDTIKNSDNGNSNRIPIGNTLLKWYDWLVWIVITKENNIIKFY